MAAITVTHVFGCFFQRGRDHGLPSYSEWRHHCGLLPKNVTTTWSNLLSDIQDPEARSNLRRLYGHPDNVDVWVGGQLETRVGDEGRVGPLVRCLIVDQFRRVRDGDR